MCAGAGRQVSPCSAHRRGHFQSFTSNSEVPIAGSAWAAQGQRRWRLDPYTAPAIKAVISIPMGAATIAFLRSSRYVSG